MEEQKKSGKQIASMILGTILLILVVWFTWNHFGTNMGNPLDMGININENSYTTYLQNGEFVRQPMNNRISIGKIINIINSVCMIPILIVHFIFLVKEYKNKEIKKQPSFYGAKIMFYAIGIFYVFACEIGTTVMKPIIYIYPEKETNVEVTLGREENLTCTYPKYENSWNVLAKPDGTLIDETGRTYYALYWESKNVKKYGKIQEGFVVKGENTVRFLEEKLEMLGLNEREAEEFIVYWLPQMENNKYNYIRFQTDEEIENNMPLNVIPKPDTVIRVVMEWKPLNRQVKVEEQELEKVERQGYTVVEWGGIKIK